jgi:hypothetical protein
MTSAVATIGLTYAGTDVQLSDLSIFLEIVHGLAEPPTVRGSDIIVPGLAGRIAGNRVNDVLPIELEGFVRADDVAIGTENARDSFQYNRATVRALFATNRARAELLATLEDGTQYTIMARPLNAIWNTVIASEFATVSISLEGYDDWELVGS